MAEQSPAKATRIIDVDQSGTWPARLADLVDDVAEQLRHSADLDVPAGELPLDHYEGELHDLLNGCLIRAYHCTRLLDHEAATIRSEGLLVLDEDLVTTRIDAALAHGHLSDDLASSIRAGQHFARRLPGDREGQVCLVVSTTAFDRTGLHHLLATWGGEAIYAQHVDHKTPQLEMLRELGRPTIVQALLDTRYGWIRPSMPHLLVGARLQLADRCGSAHHPAPIPGPRIERLIQPGDPDYDRHTRLPQH